MGLQILALNWGSWGNKFPFNRGNKLSPTGKRMIVLGLDKNFLDPLYFTPLYKDFQVRQSKLKYMFFAQMVFY